MNSFLRVLDFLFSLVGLVILIPLILILFVRGYFDTGAPLFIQTRLGKNKNEFRLVKFRTMSVGTPSVGSHEVSVSSITKYGGFLRRTKLDELPQLWNVLKGEMSLVGPRPNLPNQHELIGERQKLGVYDIRPGITGLAQVNNIDMSTPDLLAKTDQKMMVELSIRTYFKYILMTVTGKGAGDASLGSR
jgi:O-antigen biosynthesis protein WbqP